MNKDKFRAFVKTYLHCKGKCTSSVLAENYNFIGFEKHHISTQQVSQFLIRELNKAHHTTCLHNSLSWELDKNKNVRVWFLVD